MKTIHLLLLAIFAAVLPAKADINVRISVKFVLNWDGSAPTNAGNIDLSTSAAFNAEIVRGNSVLASTGRACRLTVVEYLNIQPPAPAGQAADYWYNLPARSNRQTIESASIADPGTWRRNLNGALNIYVNNSSSGSCSFIGSGDSIALGSTIFSQGTVLHEIGHFFDLSHTHASDPSCTGFSPPNPLSSGLGNGDGLTQTIPDHPCYTRDQLSMANFGANYASLSAAQQAAVDTSWLNVMSYHQEDRLLEIQMDYWCANGNGARHSVCSGYTWFVATNGSDPFSNGLNSGTPFATVPWALAHVSSPDDVVLLRSGNYAAPATITTPCTLSASYGAVTLTR
jgi:hypothetical protein